MTLSFHTPVLEDRHAVLQAAAVSHARENDAAFANLFLLRHKYRIEIAFCGNHVLRRYHAGFRAGCYGFPLGDGDLADSIAHLQADADQRGIPLQLTLLTAAQCEQLQSVLPDAFAFIPAEGYTEYLYLRQNLAEMKGSRYHKKRNHISQFYRAHPNADVQPLIPENVDIALGVAKAWLAGRANPNDPSLLEEFACIQEAADHWEALGMHGILLYANDAPVGMTMVSELSPGVWDVHFEKVVPEQRHAFPVVANEMAKRLPQAEYLNREEDLGESGMRTSKTSYRPDLLNEKFIAVRKG